MDDSYPFKPATPQQVCKPWKTVTENVKRYLERKKQLEQVSIPLNTEEKKLEVPEPTTLLPTMEEMKKGMGIVEEEKKLDQAMEMSDEEQVSDTNLGHWKVVDNKGLKLKLRRIDNNNNLNEIFPFKEGFIEKPKERLNLKYINIKTVNSRYIGKFNSHLLDLRIILKKNIPKDESNEDIVTNCLQEMVKYAKHRSNFKENDQINIIVRNPKFFYTISSGYEKADAVKRLTDKMIKILTSDKTVNLMDCLFTVVTVNMP